MNGKKRSWATAVCARALTFFAIVGPAAAAAAPCDWSGYRQSHASLWTKYVEYQKCFPENANAMTANDKAACNFFSARVLEDSGIKGLRYKDNDPRMPNLGGAFLVANDLYDELILRSSRKEGFELLGDADDEAANAKAQESANSGRLVVAARKVVGGQGHIALVIPGAQGTSGNWAPLRPPMSASWFVGRPDDAYVGCTLAYAFSKPNGVSYFATTP